MGERCGVWGRRSVSVCETGSVDYDSMDVQYLTREGVVGFCDKWH